MAIKPNINTTTSQSLKDAQISQNFQEIANREKVDVKKDENGTPNILIGYDKGGFGTEDYGIKVAQQGVDVREATDDQLVMSSAFNMFKIVQSGEASLTLDNPVTAWQRDSVSVTHDLGYSPAHIAYIQFPVSAGGELLQLPLTGINTSSGAIASNWYAAVDDTTITFHGLTNGASLWDGLTVTFKYYLLRETAD